MVCSKCGAEVSESTKFCTKCGASLSEEFDGKNKKHNLAIIIVGIIIAIVILSVWLGILFIFAGSKQPEYDTNRPISLEKMEESE